MNKLLFLYKGEITRAKKYNILAASVVVSFFWIAILEIFGIEDLTLFFPLMIYFDVTVMSMLFIGVTVMFEKQEKTLMTLLISPIKKGEYFVAKLLTNITFNMITLFILYTYASLFKTISVNLLVLILAIILISIFHATIGFLFATKTKDFTTFLINIMVYFLLLALPVLFEQIGLISEGIITNLMYLLPTKSAFVLINAALFNITKEVIFSGIYMIILTTFVWRYNFKNINKFIIKESGA